MHPLGILAKILWEKETPSSHEMELIRTAQKAAEYLSCIPGIRMVGLCNSLSFYAGNAQSDIDFFIVSTPKLLWFVRTISTLVMLCTGLRRYGKNTEWLVCLSFFATTDALDFMKIAIENDFYLISWISHLRPLLSYENTYERFIEENAWTASFLEQPIPAEENKKYLVKSSVPKWYTFVENIFWPLWRFLDFLFKSILRRKTLASYESLGRPWGVIISEDMLKFHPDDARKDLRDAVLKQL